MTDFNKLADALESYTGDGHGYQIDDAVLREAARILRAACAADVGGLMRKAQVFADAYTEWANYPTNRLEAQHDAARAALESALRVAMAPKAEEWRCFHCGESFTDKAAAALHFGTSLRERPACEIDVAEYRAMEARMHRYNEEDSDLHRAMYGMQSDHATALIREEEKGYARGLADAQKFPEKLGLTAVAASQAGAQEPKP